MSRSLFTTTFWILFYTWFLLHLFFIDSVTNIILYSQYILHIFTGIIIIKTYGKDLGVYFEKSMVLLSAISIIGWLIELMGGSNILLKIPFVFDNTLGNGDYSILFYTLASNIGGIMRNSGCAWEPGLFSVMLCIAIIFNISNKKGIKLDKRLLILLSALITTFSTTGYVVAMVILACHYIFSSRIKTPHKIIYICIIGVTFYFINNLPFMADKINSRINIDNFSINDGALEWHEKEGNLFTVDRFEGLYLDYLNFLEAPVIGYGLQREDSYVYNNISSNIITSNGIMKQFAQLGLFLSIMLLILTYKSCIKFNSIYHFDAPWILFIVIIIGSISYMFDSTPIMRAIELYALYNTKKFV